MNKCPKCQSIVLSAVKGICDNCGALLNQPADNQVDSKDDDLEFVITETSESESEFVGGAKKFTPNDDTNELGITSNAEIMENETEQVSEPNISDEISETSPIGESAPILPEPIDEYSSQDHNSIDLPPSAPDTQQKLSDAEINSIKSGMNNHSSNDKYLSDSERNELLSKINNIPPKQTEQKEIEEKKPVSVKEATTPELPKPKMAERPKAVAYFYKNFIQVTGVAELYNGDEFAVNEREYILRPKKISRNIIYTVSAGLFTVILLFIASFFIKDTNSGIGQIIGIVTTDNGTPLIESALIKFPEDNITVESNAQGFFNSGDISIGTHKILYIVNNEIIKEDYVTVMDGKISTILMTPELYSYDNGDNNTLQTPQSQKTATPKIEQKKETNKLAVKTVQKTKPKATSKKKRKTPGRIVLAANVEGAKFVLDGNVMGAGNLTYSKIKPGKHSYTVSQDGYKEAAGTFTLSSGQKMKLKVALTPLEDSEKAIQFDIEDFYYSGVSAFKEKNYETAINDLTEAINLQPSFADAVQLRGDAYLKLKDDENAFNDFVRSAEIYQFKKDYNSAITSYHKAINADDNNINAYIGRAKLYMAKGQEIAAAADFEQAIAIEDDHFQAQYGLGEARFQLNSFKDATKHFKKAQKMDKNNPLTYQYLMLCYLKRDKLKDVKKMFEKFTEVATEKNVTEFVKNKKYSAVIEVINKQ
ncbi:MAG: tetratricopeptide repeat protein [candidate division Zixibacteria bacterium]|nr:tetratricopeptide repeat protein [candidate division Zixibacteria bacterium]